MSLTHRTSVRTLSEDARLCRMWARLHAVQPASSMSLVPVEESMRLWSTKAVEVWLLSTLPPTGSALQRLLERWTYQTPRWVFDGSTPGAPTGSNERLCMNTSLSWSNCSDASAFRTRPSTTSTVSATTTTHGIWNSGSDRSRPEFA